MTPHERLRRFVDGELDAGEETPLDDAATREESLTPALEAARTVRDALTALEPDGPPEPPPDLVDRAVLAAVRRRASEGSLPGWRRALRRLTAPVVVRLRLTPTSTLVVAVGLALLGTYVYRALDRPVTVVTTPDRPSAVPSEPEAEESTLEVVVRLMLPAEGARSVAVAGDFNGWATDATPLEDPEGDGVFVGNLRLLPGSYAYMFVVDGDRWVTDPYAVNYRDDGFGNRNAVLRVD